MFTECNTPECLRLTELASWWLHLHCTIQCWLVRPRMSKYPTISISHSTSVLADISNTNLHWTTESRNYYFVTNGNQHEPTIDLSLFLSMFNHSLDGLLLACVGSSNGNPKASIWESVPFHSVEWTPPLHIGYALIKIFVRFPCFKNNADVLAYASLRVKTFELN